MDAATCLEKLRLVGVLSVATTAADGSPQVRCVSAIHYEPDALYLFTARGKDFARQLSADGRIQLLAYTRFNEMIRLSARARPVPESEQESWKDRIFAEQPYLANVYPGATRAIGTVFDVRDGFIEYFNLGVNPIEREYFPFGNGQTPLPAYEVDPAQCIGCGVCEGVCPERAISGGAPHEIAQTHCLHCGACAEACPVGAVRSRSASPVAATATQPASASTTLAPISSVPPSHAESESPLTGRRTVRAYAPEPPSRELIEEALRLASFAPNAGNRQQLQRVVIRDGAALARIGRAQTVLRAKFNAGEPLAATDAEIDAATSAFYDAPVAVALFAPRDFFFATADAYIYAHALCLAAHTLGLGSCIVGGVGDPVGSDLARALGVPETHTPQCFVLLGHPRGSLPKPYPRKYAPSIWA